MVQNQYLHDLALGPLRRVQTWPIYFINGYKFHTNEWSIGKKTINSGICVWASSHGESDLNDYYGVLKEIIQLEYPREPIKRLVLFSCDWYDPLSNRGTIVHKDYGLVEIRQNRRYAKYEPFIFAQQATQVYYAPYPGKRRDKADWKFVIKTKPRGRFEKKNTVEDAYQDEEMASVIPIIDIDPLPSLRDNNNNYDVVVEYTELGENTSGNDEELEITDNDEELEITDYDEELETPDEDSESSDQEDEYED